MNLCTLGLTVGSKLFSWRSKMYWRSRFPTGGTLAPPGKSAAVWVGIGSCAW
jgi:hypothetical protein